MSFLTNLRLYTLSCFLSIGLADGSIEPGLEQDARGFSIIMGRTVLGTLSDQVLLRHLAGKHLVLVLHRHPETLG